MMNLYLINESLTNGYQPLVLDIISILAVICGIFVIISKNPIISVLFLIALFVNISGYLILIGINFIGLSYRASVRLLLELWKGVRNNLLKSGSSIQEELVAYLIGVNNLIVGNSRETIACHERVVADSSDNRNVVQKNIQAQELVEVDTDL